MRARTLLMTGCIFTMVFVAGGAAQDGAVARSPIAVSSVTVTIEGTSKKDPFLASTRTVHVTRVQLAGPPSEDVLRQVLQPGGLEAFDLTIPVMTLTSPDEGVDEHLHSALKAETYPEIRFQLRSVGNGRGGAGESIRLTAKGRLTVAGVDREVTLAATVLRAGSWLLVDGGTDLLMTDFGVKPPQGMLGVLKTDPLIRVRFYLVVKAVEARALRP
jgi:hypothetical protein